MMAKRGTLSDSELKRRLTELGHPPGPIIQSTRDLYKRQLESLSSKKSATSHTSTQGQQSSRVASRGAAKEIRPQTPPLEDNELPKQHTTQQNGIEATSAGSSHARPSLGSSAVVSNMLKTLYDSLHPANDTVIVFEAGGLLTVSRAMLSSQCSKLITFLYSSEEPYPITVVTLTGRSSLFHTRPSEHVVDLKEKVSLSQGIPVNEQRLIHLNNELDDSATIASCGIEPGATIHLVLITTVEPQPPSLSLPGLTPSLSIAHLRVGLGLDNFHCQNSLQVPHTTLTHHTQHILHVYNIPMDGFSLFVGLLYMGELDTQGDLGSIVVAYVLSVYFDLSIPAQVCLAAIKDKLTVALATELLAYAEGVQCQPLKEVCTSVISIH